MRNPPILISVIGFFAGLAGFTYLFYGLRMLGFDWFGAFGDLPKFEHVGLWGWLAIAAGIAWLVTALGLWSLQEWARVVALIVAGFSLLEAVLAMFQFPGSGIGFGMAVLPIVLLWYLNSAEVKTAFGVADAPRS
jgi:cytochrome c oxidase subunit IV